MEVTEALTTLQLNQLASGVCWHLRWHLERLPAQRETDVGVREEQAGLPGMQMLERCLMWITATLVLVGRTIPEDKVTPSVLKQNVSFALASTQKQKLLI